MVAQSLPLFGRGDFLLLLQRKEHVLQKRGRAVRLFDPPTLISSSTSPSSARQPIMRFSRSGWPSNWRGSPGQKRNSRSSASTGLSRSSSGRTRSNSTSSKGLESCKASDPPVQVFLAQETVKTSTTAFRTKRPSHARELHSQAAGYCVFCKRFCSPGLPFARPAARAHLSHALRADRSGRARSRCAAEPSQALCRSASASHLLSAWNSKECT